MRFAGTTLLIIGFLLCVSIAWAAIGFFAMGFGLILFLIAEERKKLPALHLERAVAQPGPMEPSQLITAPLSSENAEVRQDEALCGRDKWKSLVESDQDLLRVVRTLEQFGQKYVDQLAGAYVAFNNRAFLPLILNMVVASARQDAGLSASGEMKPRNSIASPNDPSSPDGPGPDRLSEFASVAAMDQFSVGEREIHRSSRQRLAFDETPEGHAVGDGITAKVAVPSFDESPVCENNFDEFDSLKDLLDRLKTR